MTLNICYFHVVDSSCYQYVNVKKLAEWFCLEADGILFLFLSPKMRILTGFGQFHFWTKKYFVVFAFFLFLAGNIRLGTMQAGADRACVSFCDRKSVE